jgi:hypothetical protein
MPAKNGQMTDEYYGGDQEENGGFFITLLRLALFPLWVIARLFGVQW